MKNIFTFAVQFPGEMSDAKGNPTDVVERARLVHRTPSEKVCIRQKCIEAMSTNK